LLLPCKRFDEKKEMIIKCGFCKKIMIEEIEDSELETFGKYIQCPYCGEFNLNTDHIGE